MSLLLETTLGDLTLDLDVEGSPELCKNVLKLAKARYYTNTLLYNLMPNRFVQGGDPRGNGSGGAGIFGLIDASTTKTSVTDSKRRFFKSHGRLLTAQECQQRGRVVVGVNPRYYRPAEVEQLLGDPSKAKAELGWEPKVRFNQLVEEMIEADYNHALKAITLKREGFDLYAAAEEAS